MLKMERVVEMQEILDLQIATEAAEAEGDGEMELQRIKYLALASLFILSSMCCTWQHNLLI